MKLHFNALPLALAAMTLLVTGCPHNEYVVQLKPHGDRIDRSLVFYREDGVGKDGTPNYQDFGEQELAAITALYPALAVTRLDHTYSAHGIFTNELPSDVGGAGTYTNLTTSLGEAGFYVERFRGNDDLAAMTERRFKSADQLTELVVGWSEKELGQEPGYEKLRQFLQTDFRRDLKNLSSYWWEGQWVNHYNTNAGEEFAVRFGQYLFEHGYFSLAEAPGAIMDFTGMNPQGGQARLQRLVARKMGWPDSQPIPASLAFLGNGDSMNDSFNKYIADTDQFRARLKQWVADKKQNPALEEPKPEDFLQEVSRDLMEITFADTPDHLSVQLSLPVAPVHCNGKWDEELKQVVWDTSLEDRGKDMTLPVTCYADWARPNEDFQREHLGKLILTGDDLVQYCLWRRSQDEAPGREWDTFLAGLQPGADLTNRVDSFRFTGEPAQALANGQSETPGLSTFPRHLLKGVLK